MEELIGLFDPNLGTVKEKIQHKYNIAFLFLFLAKLKFGSL